MAKQSVNEEKALVTYLQILSKDTKLRRILKGEPYVLKPKTNLPVFLYNTIVNQQLSNRVGAVLYQRFLDVFGGKEPTSQQVVDTPVETLRAIGISLSKANYIKNVAYFDMEKGLTKAVFKKMTDEEAIDYVSSIKGIGRWTAHVFLMSALGREDVFAADDLILQKKVAALYKLDRADKKKFMEDIIRISEKWSPYRTYASLHLWRWDDSAEAEKS